jgi:hypothetical protein
VEALAYLTLDVVTKKLVATRGGGKWLRAIFQLAAAGDKAVRYGVISAIYNLCTSYEDIKLDYDAELEGLKKVARKGLPGRFHYYFLAFASKHLLFMHFIPSAIKH